MTMVAGNDQKLMEKDDFSDATRAHGRVPQPDRIRHVASIEESKESQYTGAEGKGRGQQV